jgi:hypothetical protein
MKQWSPISARCPTWVPDQITTSLPIFTYGWIVFSSKMKQLSPISEAS